MKRLRKYGSPEVSRGIREQFNSRILTLLAATVFLCCSGCALLIGEHTVKYIRYVVKPGDTLSTISTRFNVPIEEIEEYNEITDPKKLKKGAILTLPYRLQNPPEKTPPIAKENVKDARSAKMVSISAAKKYVGEMVWPVRVARLSSRFGPRNGNFHEGIDLAAPEGTPLYAAHSGTVVYSGNGLNGYGNLIVIKGEGIMTVYGHNERNYVERGDGVRRGERIGNVGQTGHAFGAHVHFEARIRTEKGKYAAVDPLVFFP